MAWPYNTAPHRDGKQVESVLLEHALLCVNCECIGRSRTGCCPTCGSESVLSLKKILDARPQNAQMEETRPGR